MSHDYKLRYRLTNIESGLFKAEDITDEYTGLTDCLFIGSALYADDGSYSQDFWTKDGRNNGKPWSDNDLYKFWALMSARLKDSPTLDLAKRLVASDTFEAVVALMNRNQDG